MQSKRYNKFRSTATVHYFLGQIMYGAVDTDNCSPDVVYVPALDSRIWQFSVDKAQIGNKKKTGQWTGFSEYSKFLLLTNNIKIWRRRTTDSPTRCYARHRRRNRRPIQFWSRVVSGSMWHAIPVDCHLWWTWFCCGPDASTNWCKRQHVLAGVWCPRNQWLRLFVGLVQHDWYKCYEIEDFEKVV